jgi:hypothetical protein
MAAAKPDERQEGTPRRGALKLAEVAAPLLSDAFAKQGFASREILNRWPEIAGARLAAHCRPLRLAWPRHRPAPGEVAEPALLELRVTGAFALEAQQAAPLIISRINAYLGWNAVGRIALKQGPVEPLPAPAPAHAPPPAPSGQVSAAVAKVEDEGLRHALERLGAAIAARSGR